MATAIKKTKSNTWLPGHQENLVQIDINNLGHRGPSLLAKLANYFLLKLDLVPLEINATPIAPAKTLTNLRGRQGYIWSTRGISHEELLLVEGNVQIAANDSKEFKTMVSCEFFYRLTTKFLAYQDSSIIYEVHESCSDSLRRWLNSHPGMFLLAPDKSVTINHLKFGLETFSPQMSLFALGYVPTLADHLYINATTAQIKIDSSEQKSNQAQIKPYLDERNYHQGINGILSSSGIDLGWK